MSRPTLLVSALAVLALAGCGDEAARGIVITGDGKVGANSARNQHQSAQDVLRIAIEDDLGKGWGVQVRIDEAPVWIEEPNMHAGGWGSDGNWRWDRITATVEITPPAGQQLSDAKRADLEEGSRKHLLTKLRKKDPALLAFTLKVVGPAPQVVAPPPPAIQPATGQRTYVVQPGDTLADISTAFYGTPQHWRAIAQANPAGTQAGQTIVIPAPPAAPAPAPSAP
jgi:LysM repeat protein